MIKTNFLRYFGLCNAIPASWRETLIVENLAPSIVLGFLPELITKTISRVDCTTPRLISSGSHFSIHLYNRRLRATLNTHKRTLGFTLFFIMRNLLDSRS